MNRTVTTEPARLDTLAERAITLPPGLLTQVIPVNAPEFSVAHSLPVQTS